MLLPACAKIILHVLSWVSPEAALNPEAAVRILIAANIAREFTALDLADVVP